ncbi:TPA: hypothetical protein ACRZH0_004831, partial [Escherichia coli]
SSRANAREPTPGLFSLLKKTDKTVLTSVFTVYLIAPCRGLSESAVIRYLYIFNKKATLIKNPALTG